MDRQLRTQTNCCWLESETSYPFQYNQSGHVITDDLNIIQHENLRKMFSHGH